MTPCNLATLPWLARIHQMESSITPTTFPIRADTLYIIKKLLLAANDDDEAVDRAVREIRAYYSDTLFPEDDPFYRDRPDESVRAVLGAVADQVFELAGAVPRDEVGHARLAGLLVGLKRSAAARFDSEDPQLGWDSSLLEAKVADVWRSPSPPPTATHAACAASLNTHALLARLLAADLFPSPWAAARIAECISSSLQPLPPQQQPHHHHHQQQQQQQQQKEDDAKQDADPDHGPKTLDPKTSDPKDSRDPPQHNHNPPNKDTPTTPSHPHPILKAALYILAAGHLLPRALQSDPGAATESAVRRAEWAAWAEALGRAAWDVPTQAQAEAEAEAEEEAWGAGVRREAAAAAGWLDCISTVIGERRDE